jgi:hypothetical protein
VCATAGPVVEVDEADDILVDDDEQRASTIPETAREKEEEDSALQKEGSSEEGKASKLSPLSKDTERVGGEDKRGEGKEVDEEGDVKKASVLDGNAEKSAESKSGKDTSSEGGGKENLAEAKSGEKTEEKEKDGREKTMEKTASVAEGAGKKEREGEAEKKDAEKAVATLKTDPQASTPAESKTSTKDAVDYALATVTTTNIASAPPPTTRDLNAITEEEEEEEEEEKGAKKKPDTIQEEDEEEEEEEKTKKAGEERSKASPGVKDQDTNTAPEGSILNLKTTRSPDLYHSSVIHSSFFCAFFHPYIQSLLYSPQLVGSFLFLKCIDGQSLYSPYSTKKAGLYVPAYKHLKAIFSLYVTLLFYAQDISHSPYHRLVILSSVCLAFAFHFVIHYLVLLRNMY